MNTPAPIRPFSLLIKPASGDCNLQCEYCFYLDPHSSFYPETRTHRMSYEVLERMTKSYLETPQPAGQPYLFSWQGGEPTLMGVDFFVAATALQKKYKQPNTTCTNAFQTNGVLVDERFAKFLAQEKFLTGISLDGPKEIHDHYRHRCGGAGGTFDAVMKATRTMKAAGAEFNILTLVNDRNAKEPQRVYEFLCNEGFLFHQYIPCVEPDGQGGVKPYSVSPEAWGDFLCGLFDAWYPKDTRRVSIRLFDAIFNLLVLGERNQCTMCNNCSQYLVVEYNGDIFPCDFFVEKRLKLGNLMQDSWDDFLANPVYAAFGEQKLQTNPLCEHCQFNWLCVGDCLKHRFCSGGGSPRRLSHLCEGWRRFFAHTLPRFKALAETFVAEQQRQARRR